MSRITIFVAMKFFCSFLFSVFVLFVGTKNALILTDYNINKAYYERICENKDKPEMACHGKCQAQKNSQKENSATSFHQFNAEFCQTETISILQPDANLRASDKTEASEHKNFDLAEIYYSIPVPPPNFI